jgi:hypothetical protein
MKIKIILVYIVVSITLWILINKYEDYRNEPYITVVAMNGLSNKLEVILSYLARANNEGKKLKIIWHLSEACPEKYENLFKPIPNLEVVYSDEIIPIDINIVNPEENYEYNPDFINFWNSEDSHLIGNSYSLLRPISSIQNEIDDTKQKLGNEYIACHIRRTDALTHPAYKDDKTSDLDYINFIDQYPKNLKIYIATDCRDTQKIYIHLYGDRMIYKKIEENNNFRQTSLQDAVKDMYVCAGATYFKRSVGTFSDTILNLRELN